MSEAASQQVVTELKVSGHLMALDAGVFCVFHSPGAAPPDERTGLPGVRLSLPPGASAGRIAISTFRDDGWIGGSDSAALIRVEQGPAQVLVTIYQSPDGTHEAPRLQVVKLTEAPAQPPQAAVAPPVQPTQPQQLRVPQPRPQPAPPVPSQPVQSQPVQSQPGQSQPQQARPQQARPQQARPQQARPAEGQAAQDMAEVAAHIQGRGDVLARFDDWMGERGSRAWIEGFAIAPRGGAVTAEDIEYQAVLGRGWLSPWAEGGKFCGSRGMGLPILGLNVRLRGEAARRFDCLVRATFIDGAESGPSKGEPCQAESLAPLEAFQVELVARNAARPAAAPPAAPPAATRPPATPRRVARAPEPEPEPVRRRAAAGKAPAAPAAPARPSRQAARPEPKPAAKPEPRPAAKPAAKPTGKSAAKPAGRGAPAARGRR